MLLANQTGINHNMFTIPTASALRTTVAINTTIHETAKPKAAAIATATIAASKPASNRNPIR